MFHHSASHVPHVLLLLVLEVLCQKQHDNERSYCLQLTDSVQASFNIEERQGPLQNHCNGETNLQQSCSQAGYAL